MDTLQDRLRKHQAWLQEELVRCCDFWCQNGRDYEYGGVYTCLDRQGRVYSTDKSVWMQGRCAWTFSYLCKVYGMRDEWLSFAKSCLDFLENHCINREAGGRMYFTVTADGQPLRQRRYNFSEGFYAIANAEYYGLTGEEIYLQRAQKAYDLIWQLNHGEIEDPTGLGSKTIEQTRSGRGLANPMIYLNITSVLRRVSGDNEVYRNRSQICVDEIVKYHFKPDLGCTLENVGLKGEFRSEVTEGRVVNPGHDIECAWFLLEQAEASKDEELSKTAQQIFDLAYSAGWDQEYGGLLYFIDCLGNPPESYEHDMKLWWPHNETLIASLMLFAKYRDEKYLKIFEETLNYCQQYFSDRQYGEWFGYLRRDGKPTEPPCKGSTFKGPFHLPRMLTMCDQLIDRLLLEV